MFCAFVSAVDNSSAPVGDTDSSAQDVSSANNSFDDSEGSTGDEEIELDVTYDNADDFVDDTSEESDDGSDNDSVSVSLSKHKTGIPLVILMMIMCFLPIFRHG